jgi:hypothetical protein
MVIKESLLPPGEGQDEGEIQPMATAIQSLPFPHGFMNKR